ncbi:Methanesulfonate monooxygenase [compost metagenome]
MKFQQRDSFLIQPHLWAGLTQVSDSVSVSIVGSYENVIKTIKKFNEIGTQYFILSASPNDEEIERIGQYVLPYLR